MSFDEAFEKDFGPIRKASEEEIRQEQLQRQARREGRKGPVLVHDSDDKNTRVVNSEIKTTSTNQTTTKPPNLPPANKKRQLFLTGHEELLQYLEEKKSQKLRNQQQNSQSNSPPKPSTKPTAKPPTKRLRMTLIPMEESMRQKILKELEEKKKARCQQEAEVESKTPLETSSKRRHMMLVPMEESYRQKIRAELEAKRQRKNKNEENIVNEPSKRPRMMLMPMEESYRQKILSELEQKKQKRDLNNKEGSLENSDTRFDHSDDVLVDEMSVSSGLDFEDASETFQNYKLSRSKPSSPVKTEVSSSVVALRGDTNEETEIHVLKENEEKDTEKTPEPSLEKETGEGKEQEESKNSKNADLPNKEAEIEESKFHWSEEDVKRMRKLIMSQVNGVTPLRIKESSLQAPYKEIYSILSQTIHNSESHTVLLTGAPGSGKTTIVEQALDHFQKLSSEKFIAIRLSGSLHYTDQHAIREIARQLDIKLRDFTEDTEGDTYEQRAISDTFQNILSTLFKLDDPANPGSKEELPIRVIFVIDELEKFTGNPKQTLLYNLFELAQASKVPICIVGITPKVTIREFFEKRVRSRFSQRMVQAKKAESIEAFWQDAKLALTVPEDKFGGFSDASYPKQWNEKIEELFSSSSGLTKLIYTIYYTTKNVRQANNECALAINKISQKQPFPQSGDFETYLKNAMRGIEAVIASLSPAELIVVVAAARWIAKSDPPQVNFKLAYKEYTEMMKSNNAEATTLSSKTSYIDNMSLSGIKVFRNTQPAKVLQGCWRVIYRTGLLFDVISTNNEVNATNNLNMYRETMLDDSKMLQLDVSLEELAKLIPEDNFVRRFTRL